MGIVRLLVENDFDVNAVEGNKFGESALFYGKRL